MEFSAINFQDKFSKFSELWLPKIIAQLNDYQFKPAKVKSEFVRHLRPETDEAFIVVNGARNSFNTGDAVDQLTAANTIWI